MNNTLEVRIEQKVGVLNWNFAELNRAVEDGLKKYKNLVITEEQIDDARKMRADLNNVKKLLDRRRIDAGKEFCQPYEDFKGQVKTVTSKIDEKSTNRLNSTRNRRRTPNTNEWKSGGTRCAKHHRRSHSTEYSIRNT